MGQIQDNTPLMDVPCSTCNVIILTFVGEVANGYRVRCTCPLCGKKINVAEVPSEVYATKQADGENWTLCSVEEVPF